MKANKYSTIQINCGVKTILKTYCNENGFKLSKFVEDLIIQNAKNKTEIEKESEINRLSELFFNKLLSKLEKLSD